MTMGLRTYFLELGQISGYHGGMNMTVFWSVAIALMTETAALKRLSDLPDYSAQYPTRQPSSSSYN
jgi:hypothetical protein